MYFKFAVIHAKTTTVMNFIFIILWWWWRGGCVACWIFLQFTSPVNEVDVCGGLTLPGSRAPHGCLLASLLLHGMGEIIQRAQARKLMAGRKSGLIGMGKR